MIVVHCQITLPEGMNDRCAGAAWQVETLSLLP
jgi:hypothetical protein